MEYNDNDPVINLDDIDLRPSNGRPIVSGRDNPHTLLYPGAHLATGENHGPFHHGIVIDSTDEMVIAHFWGLDKREARIQTATLSAFIAGGPDQIGIVVRPLYIINYEEDDDEKRTQTVERARQMLDRADTIHYDIIRSNCESFATHCRTGEWRSEQIARVMNVIKNAAARLGSVLLSGFERMHTLIRNSSTATTSKLVFLSLLASGSLVSSSSTFFGSLGSVPLISVSSPSIQLLSAGASYSISSVESTSGSIGSLGRASNTATRGTFAFVEGAKNSTTRTIGSVRQSVNGTTAGTVRLVDGSRNVTTQTLGSLRRSKNSSTEGALRLVNGSINRSKGTFKSS